MLQDIRKSSQGTVAKIIVGLIIVVFALFGAESIVGGLSGEPEVATVNGEDVVQSQFLRAVEGKRRQILSQMGEQADPDMIDEGLLRSSVLEGMINERILVQDADDKGLFISDMAVDNYIRNIEQFQVDGQFSNERMQSLLRNAGLTLKDYRDSLKAQFALGQSRSGLIASAFVTENEQNEILALDRQIRSFGLATIFKRDYFDAVDVTSEEVRVYYADNQASYKKSENVEVSYLVLDRSRLLQEITVSEKDLLALYETEKAEYQGEEQRAASHILIKIEGDTGESSALERINAIQARIAQGERFDDLAKEFSEDEGSAQGGGNLGMSGRGVYVSGFEQALFGLSEGQVSAPVKTEFGYHLIKLNSIESNSLPSFDEMRGILESRLVKQKVDKKFAEMSEQIADISYSSPDLNEAAESLKLEIKNLVGVSESTDHPLFSNRRVQKVLFSNELVTEKHNSELITIDDGIVMVFRVDVYHSESMLPFEAVSAIIRDQLKSQKTAAYAAQIGQAFIDRVQLGENPEQVSENMKLNWQQYSNIRRDNVMLDREVITQVFTLPKAMADGNSLAGFGVLDGDFAVVSLTNVEDGDPSSINAMERSSIESMLGDTYGASDYQSYQKVAIDSAKIERRNSRL